LALTDDASDKTLEAGILGWLNQEGFPTEFQTANLFRKHGFTSRQGIHVRADRGAAPREVDVLATLDRRTSSGVLLRCEFVVECKWSKDKPWIVFTSPTSRLHPAACIAQTMSSALGSAALWLLAGAENCQALSLFEVSDTPGFGGRQAFSKSNDIFYAALASVTGAATSIASEYDQGRRKGALPQQATIVFPIVVVDGDIFKASYDAEKGDMRLERD
jgi:hypothetical protein